MLYLLSYMLDPACCYANTNFFERTLRKELLNQAKTFRKTLGLVVAITQTLFMTILTTTLLALVCRHFMAFALFS